MTCLRLISFLLFMSAMVTGVSLARNFTLHLEGGNFNVNGSITAGNYTASTFCQVSTEGNIETNGTLSVSSNATGFYFNGTNSIGYFTNSTGSKVFYYLETTGGFSYSGSQL